MLLAQLPTICWSKWQFSQRNSINFNHGVEEGWSRKRLSLTTWSHPMGPEILISNFDDVSSVLSKNSPRNFDPKNRHVHPMFQKIFLYPTWSPWFDVTCSLVTVKITRVTQWIQPGPTGIRALRHREVLRIHHHQTGGDDESLGGSDATTWESGNFSETGVLAN